MDDTISFIEELPHKLRVELAYRIHQKILSGVSFFDDKPKDFVAFVGNLLRPVRYNRGQFIFKQGDPVLEGKLHYPSPVSLLYDEGRSSVRRS